MISEVLWMGSDLSASDEWIEIACTGSGSTPLCVLDGWTLTSLNTSGVEVSVVRFGTGTTIASGSALVVGRYPASSSRLLQDPAVVTSSMTLPNTKLLLRLWDADGNVRDTADDGIGDPMSGNNAKAPESKASMVRIDLASSGELKENWTVATTAQGLDPDALVLATPGYLPRSSASSSTASSFEASSSITSLPFSISSSSITSSGFFSSEPFYSTENSSTESDQSSSSVMAISLWISELFPDPIGDDNGQWIELVAQSDVPLDRVRIRDDKSGKTLPLGESGTLLLAGDRMLLSRAKIPAALSHAGGTVSLIDSVGSLLDQMTFPSLPEGVSYGRRSPSAIGEPYCVPSPGQENAIVAPAYVLDLQSGSYSAPAPHSINIQILPVPGQSLAGVSCAVDFDDGIVVSTCNPPSHRYVDTGRYFLTASIVNYCGTTVELTQEVAANGVSSSGSSSMAPASLSGPSLSESAVSEAERGAHMVFTGALPNPEGKDTAESEWIGIVSTDAGRKVFDGWSVRVEGKTVLLPRLILDGGTAKKLTAVELHITLRNTSGSLLLQDSSGQTQSRLHWSDAKPGQVILVRPERADGLRVRVTEVLDGDTFDAYAIDDPGTSLRVRLIGVDAPELKDRNPVVRSMADQSKKFLIALLEEKEVELNFDSNDQEDPYGRVLAYVNLSSGEHVQKAILTEGMAWVTTAFSFYRKTDYQAYETAAREAHRGIWVHPLFDQLIKDQKSGSGLLAYIWAQSDNFLSNTSGIRISEALSHPSSGSGEWIELVNTGTGAVDLRNWLLDDEESAGSKPWRIARPLPLVPGEYAVFPKSVTKLSLNDAGDIVRLLAPDGSLADRVSLPKLPPGSAYAWTGEREPADPEEAYCVTLAPTPGGPNRCVEPVTKKKKASVAKASAAKRKASAKTASKKEPILSFASLLPQAFDRPQEDVVFSSSSLAVSLSLSQVFVIVLAAMLAGALSGVAAAKGVTLARRV